MDHSLSGMIEKQLSAEELRKRMEMNSEAPPSSQVFPEHLVGWFNLGAKTVERLQDCIQAAEDERPLQNFLAEQRGILVQLLGGGHGRWCIPKPSFGGELIPDFIIGERSSIGFEWYVVELESPRAQVLTAKGVPAEKLRDAQRQVQEFRTWVGRYSTFLREHGYHHLGGDFDGYFIIIGRGRKRPEKLREAYKAQSRDRTVVMSYDRLLAIARGAVRDAPRSSRTPAENSQQESSGDDTRSGEGAAARRGIGD